MMSSKKRFYADLHIHSRYSRATSKELAPFTLSAYGAMKGLDLIGTGDMTHPAWLSELNESLELNESGLYSLKGKKGSPQFIPTGEVSCIYKDDGKTRKIHLLFIAPDLEAAQRFSQALGQRGNVVSDGRPILGMSSRDILEIALMAEPRMICVPAHVWTPWFSLFGSMSGYDRLEDCFKDLSRHIKSLETGLSSDPEMNRLISALDGYSLVSSSDAHSPDKLGREATVIEGPLNRETLWSALSGGPELYGTVEFFPEEGKYHLDGHADCKVVFTPEETRAVNGICPICGKPLTIGVLNRVMELADRGKPPESLLLPDWHILPLSELLGQVFNQGPQTKAVKQALVHLLRIFGSEYHLLLDAPLDQIEKEGSLLLRVGVERMRKGEVETMGGFDGVFGKVLVLSDADREELTGRGKLFQVVKDARQRRQSVTVDLELKKLNSSDTSRQASLTALPKRDLSIPESETPPEPKIPEDTATRTFLYALNDEQRLAVETKARTLCVSAGPGSGKTRVLVARALWYLSEGVYPEELLLTTFTRKATQTIKERLIEERPSAAAVRVATIHALAHRALLEDGDDAFQLAPEDFLCELSKKLTRDIKISPSRFLQLLSRAKNLMLPISHNLSELSHAMNLYQEALKKSGFMDFDDLVLTALPLAARAAGRYKAVMADECQDLSPLEFRFLTALSKDSELTLIGDLGQRIYGFKGALSSFEEAAREQRGHLTKVHLSVNYRSTTTITLASESLREKVDSVERNAFSQDKGRPIVRATLMSPRMEASYVVARIKSHLGTMFLGGGGGDSKGLLNGLSLGDIAIIYRLRIQGEEILKTLVEEGLPCQISGEDEVSAQDGLDLKADKISLLTMHAAKGLEFRLVFITGLEDGIIPILPWYEGESKDSSNERLMEEKRLFYVAVTRARDQLYITRARRRRLYGRFLSGEPSPFWSLIPDDLVTDARLEKQPKLKTNPLFL
ncbi:MAG: UvrD-helicase domain-containing protein [Deltaproteobacteria bacterium]|jgi:DNA helicase-2/ATP-dependent DNA helicase PcrA|nr:UvrD-helicase domain-containing protein [Deltaproteobacteria bacterium]